jgi:hypothetical protein
MFPATLFVALEWLAPSRHLPLLLGSVDARHTGGASGLNSALARIGGLVVTALIGGIIAVKADAIFAAFHVAVVACAIVIVAGIAAFFLVGLSKGRVG